MSSGNHSEIVSYNSEIMDELWLIFSDGDMGNICRFSGFLELSEVIGDTRPGKHTKNY